jgi:single-strand DNA-binding protein
MITMNVSGNICADAIIRNVNGTDMVTFSVASNRRYKTKSGESKEEVTYINCVIWNKTQVAELLFKGRAVNVTGYFNVRNYVGSDGVLRPFYNVRVSSFEVFGKAKAKDQPAPEQPQQQEQIEHVQIENQNNDPAPEILDDLPF